MPGGQRFDFVVRDAPTAPLYLEVKTVEPHSEDSDANWKKQSDAGSYRRPLSASSLPAP